ncbi:acid tolerance protein [Aureimonas endophytica]|uniref:Acid tolerance protein n=1 Tax=Aureimonas endophytica TaxID=2027858 RepID=A0A916ZF34_9HYPH|nr:virulence factor family protein [Aureimonas endophytica]GGD94009.1 acid tolerance protein [Aureimonas endophytica]
MKLQPFAAAAFVAAALAGTGPGVVGFAHAQNAPAAPQQPTTAAPAAPAPAAPTAPAPASSDDDEEDPGFRMDVTLPSGAKATVNTGMIPSPKILFPKDGTIAAAVVLLSDEDGWGEAEDQLANDLLEQDAIVVGVDLPRYLAELEKTKDECVYTISDIEQLNQQLQRAVSDNSLRLPIVAGVGAGGSLALAMLSQTPDNTIQATVAVDPDGGITLKKDLCTDANREDRNGKALYGLEDRPLPDPTTVIFTPGATDAGRNRAAALSEQAQGIEIEDTDNDDPQSQLGLAIGDLIDKSKDVDPDTMGLPLTILDAKPTRDTMAVIYSGDGGWRDIDKSVGDIFQKDGLPTVGVDALRYFWKKQTPDQTAADLSRIIDRFRKRWGVSKVLLVGYSFGADILPTTFNHLPPEQQKDVAMLSLLAFSSTGDFQISVSGWLGVGKAGDTDGVKDAEKIDPKLIQCVYGTEDEDDACKFLKDRGVELVGIEGGHHFDEDYPALANKILAALDRRLKPESASK